MHRVEEDRPFFPVMDNNVSLLRGHGGSRSTGQELSVMCGVGDATFELHLLRPREDGVSWAGGTTMSMQTINFLFTSFM